MQRKLYPLPKSCKNFSFNRTLTQERQYWNELLLVSHLWEKWNFICQRTLERNYSINKKNTNKQTNKHISVNLVCVLCISRERPSSCIPIQANVWKLFESVTNLMVKNFRKLSKLKKVRASTPKWPACFPCVLLVFMNRNFIYTVNVKL